MPLPQFTLPFDTDSFSLSHENNTYTFVLPADPDRVIDAVPESAYEKDRFLPYWAENWPSAAPFFSLLLHSEVQPQARIIEIGCGLGVVATAAAVRNLFTVAIDISPESCQFAQCNISQNGGVPRVVCADWRTLPFKGQFDLLLASDVLYEERWIEVILDAADTLLAPEGKALIADPQRRFWSPFKHSAVNRNFRVTSVYCQRSSQSDAVIEIVELSRE